MKPTAPSSQKQQRGARVVLKKTHPSAGAGAGALSGDSKTARETLQRYEQDLLLLSRRLQGLQGDVPGDHFQPESQFVQNLRSSVEKNSSPEVERDSTERLHMLEKILEKLGEVDRVILKKTQPESGPQGAGAVRPRRKSKDGSDLFSLPTHLLLVDRLLDVFTASQRLQIIEKQKGNNEKNSQNVTTNTNKEIEKLKKQLSETETARDKYKEFASAKDAEFEKYKLDQKEGGKTKNAGDSTLTVIGDGKAIVSVEVDDQRNKQIEELKAKLQKSEQKNRDMEERMEIIATSEQNMLNGIASITFALGNTGEAPTPQKLNLKFLNIEAKQATDQLLTTVVDLVSSKSKAAVEQYNDILQENKLATVEFDAYKATIQKDIARKNAEILALQESLTKAYDANEKSEKILQEFKDKNANSRKELIEEYEQKIQQYRADNAAAASTKRQLEKMKSIIEELQKQCTLAEDKSIELNGTLGCVKSDLSASEKINQNLMDTIKKMTNQANKNDFADTFEEVMRDEMMAMKSAFEAKLKIARDQTEAMSKKRQNEISRIEASRSSSGLR